MQPSGRSSCQPHHTTPHHTTKLAQQLRNLALAIPLLILAACGGGGGGDSPPAPATNLVATAVLSTAPVANCPNGGVTVEGGIDSNGNKILDPAEVTSTQYVCNGAVGSSGLNTLVLATTEPAGANCATGGNKINAGQDANANNTLDAAEITSTAYVCNGANGTNGSNGGNGANGANGLNSLVSIVPEPAGAMCTYGGSKVSSGVDSNANNVLDAAEITTTSYACNGAPGPGITWVNVTGTSVQAAANTGYLANNDAAQVTITLPTAPVLGDIVQVSGIGAGGWKVTQNAGQSILAPNNLGKKWTARDATRNWKSVASSADGIKLVAADSGFGSGGLLYTSTDSGITWTARDTNRIWTSVASSADGIKLVAADALGLYTSTDSGITWTAYVANSNWQSVASSADGIKLVAAAKGGQLYTSIDSGITWTARDAARNWQSVASSADGSKLVAADSGVSSGGWLYTSTDSGITWTARDTNRIWTSVASSADGIKLVAADSAGLYTSTDSGITWTAYVANRNWQSVASSADGIKLVAADSAGLYTSTDSGITWTARDKNRTWTSVASSADGYKLLATERFGQLYTSTANTLTGVTGFISGAKYDAVDLQCVGNNTFMVRDYSGTLLVQ